MSFDVIQPVLPPLFGRIIVQPLTECLNKKLPVAPGTETAVMFIQEVIGIDPQGQNSRGGFAGLHKGVWKSFRVAGTDENPRPLKIRIDFVKWNVFDKAKVVNRRGPLTQSFIVPVTDTLRAYHHERLFGKPLSQLQEQLRPLDGQTPSHP